jgi:hypothetical protein
MQNNFRIIIVSVLVRFDVRGLVMILSILFKYALIIREQA